MDEEIRPRVPVVARVREWHEEDGWGVLDAEETPGGCWVHFSAVKAHGYRSLRVGAEVELRVWEAGRQDGYDFRALEVVPR